MKKLALIGLLIMIGLTTQAQREYHIFTTVHTKQTVDGVEGRMINSDVDIRITKTVKAGIYKIDWFSTVESMPILGLTVEYVKKNGPAYIYKTIDRHGGIIGVVDVITSIKLSSLAEGQSGILNVIATNFETGKVTIIDIRLIK